jgi:hypothetical protein
MLPQNLLSRSFLNDGGLIIGIENYDSLLNVKFARKDALNIKDIFSDIGCTRKNIISLIDSEASKARIEGVCP